MASGKPALIMEALRQALAKKGSVRFAVKARPSAKRTGWRDPLEDGTYRIDIAATPEDGQASKALVDFLAEAFDVPVSHVTIESGITSRLKRILVVR